HAVHRGTSGKGVPCAIKAAIFRQAKLVLRAIDGQVEGRFCPLCSSAVDEDIPVVMTDLSEPLHQPEHNGIEGDYSCLRIVAAASFVPPQDRTSSIFRAGTPVQFSKF